MKKSRIEIKKIWGEIAKEEVSVQIAGDSICAFCSELASLRLYKHYKGVKSEIEFNDELNLFCFRTTLKRI